MDSGTNGASARHGMTKLLTLETENATVQKPFRQAPDLISAAQCRFAAKPPVPAGRFCLRKSRDSDLEDEILIRVAGAQKGLAEGA